MDQRVSDEQLCGSIIETQQAISLWSDIAATANISDENRIVAEERLKVENVSLNAKLELQGRRAQDEPQAKRDAAAKELAAALARMDALMDILWKSVPWGQTTVSNFALLNEAPGEAKAALQAWREACDD